MLPIVTNLFGLMASIDNKVTFAVFVGFGSTEPTAAEAPDAFVIEIIVFGSALKP